MTSSIKLFVLIIALASNSLMAKSISSFTKEMTAAKGFYTFYYDDSQGKVYLDIDKLSQPFLFQSSMPQGLGSNDIGLDRGQLGDTRIVQFERYGNKVFLNQLNTYYRADSDNQAEQKSVEEAFAKSVLQGFTIVSQDGNSVLIDYTPFLLSDIHGIKRRLDNKKQGKFSLDTSRSAVFLERSKAFPKNTELESVVSFKGTSPGKHLQSIAPDAHNITVHLHHSLIELPDDKYQPRVFHPYSGFWSIEYKDYAASLDNDMSVKYIPRHRLQKKNPNAEKSEAVEPIIYYLDPGAPEPVRSALLDGAKWWNTAFEQAGYINAFQVKMLPDDADPMDVRYNTIQWVHRATRGWSYGSSVIDPRTGEILKGHVTLGSLRVRQDYLIAQGLTAPFKGEDTNTNAVKEMALARIRQLSAHEVGHTLGISHNFSASVNNRASVMDYPHPLVKITNGEIDLSDAYDNKIGPWDSYVIKYGYSEFATPEIEKQQLSNLMAKTRQQGYLYMSDSDARPLSGAEPNGHLWDNGDNPAVELERMLKVRKLALNNFGLDNLADGRNVSDLQEILVPIYLFHRFQVTAAAKVIGGVDYSYQVKEDVNVGVTAVSFTAQQEALNAILLTLSPAELVIPQHIVNLIPPKAYGAYRNRESAPTKTGLVFDPIELAAASAQHSLNALLNPARLNRLVQQSSYQLDTGNWSLSLYLQQILDSTIKADMDAGVNGLLHKRVAALTVESLMNALLSDGTSVEVKAELFQSLQELSVWLSSYSRKTSFNNLVNHHLAWYFEHRKWLPLIKPTALPPGSPI
ncbi:periplasmic metalloprotease [Psychrosphaera saromensis]|nr:zinc-dependent metalloprotease [Psychrosphaera saromensis]GHB66102.1 periplasmic metalloprotease [Psychrosphaera saromensis]GLQ14857.1 periplasmic metalloprotease [Psychrosphaera saromensis]